jgi:DNA-binding MarR family transcriptional regulator
MERENTIDHCLRATWQAVAKMYNEQAAKHDTTMATAMALLNIDTEKGTPSTALGPRMGMEATSLSRILKSMEKRGVITRESHPEDKRIVLIKLTDFGRKKRTEAKGTVLTFNNAVNAAIDKEKIDHFFEVAQKINELIVDKAIYKQE